MADLITLVELKPYLKIEASETAFDTLLTSMISEISKLMQNFIGCDVKEATYPNIKVNGSGRSVLDLPNWPITAVSSITEDGVTLAEGTDFDIDPYGDHLIRLDGTTSKGTSKWSKGIKNITVSYTAGFSATPSDLSLACKKQIGHEWKQQTNKEWGETSRSFPDGSVAFTPTSELLDSVKAICKFYKKVRL
jgi:hypothetical protein